MEYELIKPINQNFSAIEQVNHFLNTSDKDILDPSTIDRIEDGLKILVKHISNADNVLLQVDSDCDGMTSSAFLLNYLHRRFPAFVENHIKYRFHEGKQHGIILESVPK